MWEMMGDNTFAAPCYRLSRPFTTPNRPFQTHVWSCITSYPLWGLPYLAYDNVNPAMVNSMMLHSSMHNLKRSIDGASAKQNARI